MSNHMNKNVDRRMVTERVTASMLDLLEDLKAAEESQDENLLKRKLAYADKAQKCADMIIRCEVVKNERVKIAMDLAKMQKTNIDIQAEEVLYIK